MTYAEIRQRVLAQLSPAMNRAEIPALLHTLAYIALHRDAQEAAAAMLAGGPDRRDGPNLAKLPHGAISFQ
jgi:hypothetical protein